MAKLLTAQPKFKMLVANLTRGSDPSRNSGGNPVKARMGFEQQLFQDIPRGPEASRVWKRSSPGVSTYTGLLTGSPPVGVTGTVTVVDNDFSSAATLTLGLYTVTSGEDFTVGGGVNLTATALAAAVDGLPGFTAVAVLAVVTITGPFGPDGNDLVLEVAYTGSIANYTLSPTDGFFSGGVPDVGPPTIF